MVRKANIVEKEGLGGGKGKAIIHHIVPKEDLYGHGRMFAEVHLQVGACVGWHKHVDTETEPYYILSGKGLFTDNDGTKTEVGPGDVCTILPGQSHSLDNLSDTDELVFIALIHNN